MQVLSLSVMYSTEQGPKYLDIVSKDKKECDIWLTGLRVSCVLCTMMTGLNNQDKTNKKRKI